MSKIEQSMCFGRERTRKTSEVLETGRNVDPKSWPKNCVWPAPIGENEGFPWDEDLIPDELDVATQELVDIKHYFDGLRDKGFLCEDYSLNWDYDAEDAEEDVEEHLNTSNFYPEMGDDYWDDGFMIEVWHGDLSVSLNMLKIEAVNPDPIFTISKLISYRFINENLLRQAFTRRAFQQEYHLSGCSEELEFMGDSILNLHVTKELMKHFTSCSVSETDAPFCPKYDEGQFSKLKAKFVCKEHLSKRCAELGLEKFILYGTSEEHTDSACEDLIEAIIGAVAIDCDWNWDVLETVIDKIIDLQINNEENVNSIISKSHYEIFNAWHQKNFGCMPEYQVYKKYNRKKWLDRPYYGYIKFCVPGNDKGLEDQIINYDGETRSQVREFLAELAYDFIVKKGLWMNLKDAGVVPEIDKSIGQLQEMFQKGYIEKAEYIFNRDGNKWECLCMVNGIQGKYKSFSKADAKKNSAYEALILLLKAAGCCEQKWFEDMVARHADMMTGKSGINQKTENIDDTREDSLLTIIPSKFPDGPIGLKYVGLVDVLTQIPEGQIITERVLTKWLGGVYGIENLMILFEEIPRPYAREEDIPFHRFLTTKGLIDGYYSEVLKTEGHEIVETKTDNWRVLDYKATMVDVKKLKAPDKEKAIGHPEHFLKFVKAEIRETLEHTMKERGFLQ